MSLSTGLDQETSQLVQFAKEQGVSLPNARIQIAAMKSQLVKVYLKNGIGLTSPVVSNDEDFILLLDKKGGYNLVNTQAVSTVQTLQATDDSAPVADRSRPTIEIALEQLIENDVHVFLVNGVRLDGRIALSDKQDLALMPMIAGHGVTQIIRWDSIASIQGYDPDNIKQRRY